jgi:hypothetical protein
MRAAMLGAGLIPGFYGVPPEDAFFPSPAGVAAVNPWAALAAGGGAALMTALGLTGEQVPASMYIFGDSATVGTDLQGANTLAGTGLAIVSEAKLGGDALEWTDNSSDAMAAASAGVFDATTAIAILMAGVVVGGNPAADRSLASKREAAGGGSDGYVPTLRSTGGIRMTVDGETGTINASSTDVSFGDGNSWVAIFGCDPARANEVFVVSNREARVEANNTNASLTSTSTFGVGKCTGASLNSAGFRCRLLAVWTTLPATTFAQSHCAALKTYLGI